jgi:hypothetical protein
VSKNLYRELRDEVVDRTVRPGRHPSFVFFFIIAVLGFSALGVWLELVAYIYTGQKVLHPNPTDPLRTAILTFFPAVAGTAAMQLIWAETSKHFRSAAFFLLVLFFVVALLISPAYITNASAIVVGTLASVLSMWVWWIANAKQADLLDTVNPADSVGGDNPEAKLSGSLDEFRH